MAIYYSNKFVFNNAGQNTVQPIFNAAAEVTVVAAFQVNTALATADRIHMMTIPPNVKITGLTLDVDALDTGTGLTLGVGDATNGTNAWIPQTHAGNSSAGSVILGLTPGFLANTIFTTATDIQVSAGAIATTAILGGYIRLAVTYSAQY